MELEIFKSSYRYYNLRTKNGSPTEEMIRYLKKTVIVGPTIITAGILQQIMRKKKILKETLSRSSKKGSLLLKKMNLKSKRLIRARKQNLQLHHQKMIEPYSLKG